jgi:hypothetical protein
MFKIKRRMEKMEIEKEAQHLKAAKTRSTCEDCEEHGHPPGISFFFSRCFSCLAYHSEEAKQRILSWEYNLISKPKGAPC